MALFESKGGANFANGDDELEKMVVSTIEKSGCKLRRMLLLPPDHTRLNSYAGRITEMIWERYCSSCQIDIMPALGTHSPMGDAQLELMFGAKIPKSAFRVHDWRNDVVKLGTVPADYIRELSQGRLDYAVAVEVNKLLFDGYDLIVSIGQVVPHEVVGMANYTKNIMVGVGGSDIINKSHFLGAVSNLETIMGHADTPVRRLFNYGVDHFLGDLPIVYMQTVMGKDPATGGMAMRGFFSGTGGDAFERAAALAVEANLTLLDEPLKKVIAYLDPEEFKSTWLGNKAVYRTRMAIADDGDLIILAPGLKEFGEDPGNDALIRKYGYFGTPHTLKMVEENADLRAGLGAAAHLIHGSSEGRFRITYCPGDGMSMEMVRSVGFEAASLDEMMKKYNVASLKDGFNTVNGEPIFYISNPALGLWALKRSFK
ncbi:MAG: lactate racemase domain-containing protein [Victivallaceae bacterium]|nr:lactate racemase domain-containing protein [Victivallaceae bacterium]